MSITTVSSRDFARDLAQAKRATTAGSVWAGLQSILPAPERPSLGGHSGADRAACATILLRDGGMRSAHIHRAIAEHGQSAVAANVAAFPGVLAQTRAGAPGSPMAFLHESLSSSQLFISRLSKSLLPL
jgi:hypothetical protein